MEIRFLDRKLQKIFENGRESGKPKYPIGVVEAFIEAIHIMAGVKTSGELSLIHSLGFEKLKKKNKVDYRGFHAVRANDQYRVIFKLIQQGTGSLTIEIAEISELVDYH